MANKVKALDCTNMYIMQLPEPHFSIFVTHGAVRKRYISAESYVLNLVASV